MASKNKKGGLGLEWQNAFLPQKRQETDTATRATKAAGEGMPKRTPRGAGRQPQTPSAPIAAREELESEEVSQARLTMRIPQSQLDQLEELKERERRRLRADGVRNYREQVTVTTLVNQAIAEFLAKKREENG